MAAIRTAPGSTLTEARRAANKCHLGDVFDAYQAFCAYSNLPGTWKVLAIQLAAYLDAQYFKQPGVKLSLAFQSDIPFPTYLAQLETKELGYLASDAVDALFHATGVFVRSDCFKRDTTTSFVDVASWEYSSATHVQSLARKYYQRLDYADIHLLLDGVKYELYLRSTASRAHLHFKETISPSWAPCSDSHLNILLRLENAIPESDIASLNALGFLPTNPTILDYSRKFIGFGDSNRISSLVDRSESNLPVHNLSLGDYFYVPKAIQMQGRTQSFLRRRILPRSKQRTSATNTNDRHLNLTDLGTITEDTRITQPFSAMPNQDITSVENPNETSSSSRWSTDMIQREARRDSQRSSFSDYKSFITALTHRTGSSMRRSVVTMGSERSLHTNGTVDKRSTMQTFVSWPAASTHTGEVTYLSQWSSTLKQRDVVPDPDLENWSAGRGQHAEYRSEEHNLIPLIVEHTLGETATAVVESVRCMRVQLVRKTITCNWRIKREDALQEVKLLYRAQHSHIVRLVGTYVIDNKLAILTYPCAEWNLEQFLVTTPTAPDAEDRTKALSKFFKCLAKVLDFIHSYPIKHMDIKPQNILVRDIRQSAVDGTDSFKVYLTDFGSSRLYPSIEDSETDNVKSFTRAYAAQEVVLQATSDLRADVFSMGCVYAEMLATILDACAEIGRDESQSAISGRWNELMHARGGSDGKPRPYHLKRSEVCNWVGSLPIDTLELIVIQTWIPKMLEESYIKRPFAQEIASDPQLKFECLSCTLRPEPEDFEAAPPLLSSSSEAS
jgi:hypothetical protein